MSGDPGASGVSIFAVLVLYQCSLEQSASWRSIRKQVETGLRAFELLVCVNDVPVDGRSRGLSLPAELPAWVEVVSVAGNYGLAWAYDYALTIAKESGTEWMLTLDQDTELPDGFLLCMEERANQLSGRSMVGAIVPRLVNDEGKALSPVAAGVRERRILIDRPGVVDAEVRAYNSGALIRVAALERSGGYDHRFWLDYLDHSVFHALHVHGFRVWVESELKLRHQLSLEDGREAMTEERFRNFATAEAAFRDLHAGWAGRLLYLGRLILRAVNQRRRGDPLHFFETTLRLIRERLLVSRVERLRRWEASIAGRVSIPEIRINKNGTEIEA